MQLGRGQQCPDYFKCQETAPNVLDGLSTRIGMTAWGQDQSHHFVTTPTTEYPISSGLSMLSYVVTTNSHDLNSHFV